MITKISCTVTLMLALFFCNQSFAQKELDTAALEKRSNDLSLKIENISAKIERVEYRLMSLDETQTLSPEVTERLNDLYDERERLMNIKRSVDASLNKEIAEPTKRIITKEQYDQYPLENQQLIMAHPERYTVQL